MRVLQVMASGLHGGAELFFEDLVPALALAGVAQSAVIRPYPTRAAKLAAAGVPSVMLPFRGPFDLVSRWRLRTAARTVGPDIVIGWMNRACAALPRGPWVNLGRLGGYYDLKYYRACDHLVCNTPDIAAHMVRQGMAAAHVSYIPNFCPVRDEPPVVRASLATPEAAPVLLVLARLQPAKGIDVAIRALTAWPDAILWIAGDGLLQRRLERLAADLGVVERVRFLGWREDRSALLKAANLCLVPSRHEPFGNVVINAWAHGVPVIAAASQGPSYLIRQGEDGVVVPVDDADALAAAARDVFQDAALAQKLVRGGLARSAAEFSQTVVVEAYRKLFDRLQRS